MINNDLNKQIDRLVYESAKILELQHIILDLTKKKQFGNQLL